uniref:AP-4 complex subunit epsilon n=1 Tax=Amphiprion ocellaris TaxID=80972 RepID=A0A3Q1AHP2_AMPOC
MSDVVEKTLTALPSLLSLDSQPGSAKLSSTSKLGNLIRGITELTSKHEEEKLIQCELSSIKEQVSSPNTTMMKELMVRTIYCEMLGYEASFSYIHAIKLAQQGSVLEKRVGYLAVSLFLNESHELLLLLVNTVLKDLQSTNLIEVCMALTVVSQMFPKDMIPAILPLVEEKLNHPKEIIRRKAVLALYKFYLIAPNQVQHIHNKFRKALCDKDPGVMTASLHIYLQMIQENPEGYKDLTASFVTILKQVVGGKLPMDFNYHSVPAPWLQIQLLRILSLLGKNDQSTSEIMHEVLDESLRRAEMNHNITYAILYECVKCVYTIHPKSELLEKAAKCIGNFVLSPKINLKYLGLKALTYVVQQDPKLALQHQMTIIECLDHPDLIIKRETLELLFRITNAQNVTVIVEKMLEFLRISKDDHTTIDLVGKVAELAEKYPSNHYTYAPDNEWFIETMNTVFSVGGDMMQPDIPNSFLKLLSEGFDSVEEDRKLRLFAVNSYISLLRGEPGKLPQRFLQVISWVLGEYSHLRADLEPALVLRLLAKLLDMKNCSSETKSWVLTAMTKLCEGGSGVSVAQQVSETYGSSLDTVLRQRAQELQHLSQDSELRARVLPRGAGLDRSLTYCHNLVQVDSSLSFLDGFVSEALAAGAAPYKPPHQRQEELAGTKALSLEPYGLSLPISMSSCITDRQSPTLLSMSSGLSATLKLDGVKRVWGREGYLSQKEPVEEPAQVEVPSPLRSPSQQGEADSFHSQTPSLTPTPESDQEKQQLASSLFVGLGSQSSVCLMGKSEPTTQRFRRKAKGHSTASSTSEQVSNSVISPPSTVDNLLCNNLLDSNITSELAVSSPQLTSRLSQGLAATNGTCDTDTELPESDRKESKPAVIRDSYVVAADPAPHEDPDRPKDLALSSHLPAELSELSHSEITHLCTNQNLELSVCHVQKEDSLLLIVFISNSSDSAVQQILVCLFSGVLFGEEAFTCWCDVVGIVSLLISRVCCRPLTVSTEEYGTMWLAFSHDTKQNLTLISDGQEPLTATLNVLKRRLQLHVVEIIGMEGIVACRLLQDQPCLMHCRVHAGTLAVWLRSPIPDLPDCLIYHCQRALQGH